MVSEAPPLREPNQLNCEAPLRLPLMNADQRGLNKPLGPFITRSPDHLIGSVPSLSSVVKGFFPSCAITLRWRRSRRVHGGTPPCHPGNKGLTLSHPGVADARVGWRPRGGTPDHALPKISGDQCIQRDQWQGFRVSPAARSHQPAAVFQRPYPLPPGRPGIRALARHRLQSGRREIE